MSQEEQIASELAANFPDHIENEGNNTKWRRPNGGGLSEEMNRIEKDLLSDLAETFFNADADQLTSSRKKIISDLHELADIRLGHIEP